MPTAMATIEHATQLLDFSQKLDITLLDSVVSCFYMAHGPQQRMADQILTQLKQHPDAWTRVDTILEFSNNQQTKYFALQILEAVIKTRWKVLPTEQCEGIKKYIVGLIIKISSEAEMLQKEKTYIGKLNMILVEILKHEWPKKWPTFVSDIVGASKANESLCQNNMVILKLLSEEVFDFSSGQMTQAKAKHLKDSMCSEFSQIFTLCQFVMENSQNVTLIGATLETLLRFLNWIPLGYIFETQLTSTLVYKFLNVPMFRNVTLKCLTEIAGIGATQYDEQFVVLFSLTMAQLKQMLPLTINIKDAYANGKDDEQKFIQNLSLFLCTFLKEHGQLVEKKEELHTTLLEALHYLVLISEVEETEIFKICLEYWNALASDLYRENPFPSSTPLLISQQIPPRRQMYLSVLSKVRLIMIARMAKPEEVLVVENDQGEVVREFMKDTDAINLYKNMRETLVYLTHLDYQDTERIMTEKLQNQVNGTEWSWKNLNTLCWAVGSISGAMHEEDEKRFLVTVIKDLLGLCEIKRGKDNKAIIASNIMYIVGQYPRFLRAHWKFLKTVVNKLFEFMHETHDGVQDMACDTFIKIAQKCRRHFVQVQVGEVMPFIEEILNNTQSIVCDLQPLQVMIIIILPMKNLLSFFWGSGWGRYYIHIFRVGHSFFLFSLKSKYNSFSFSFFFFFQGNVTEHIPQIFDAVFECTLEMINKNFEEFPEHRTNFFILLQAVVQHCFKALLSIPAQQFKLVLDSIVWAFKHTMRNVADIGLHILYSLLKSLEQETAVQSFYQTYYMMIVQHVLSVVTDTSHTAGLTMHATILAHMFNLVETSKVSEPLFPVGSTQYPSNQAYVQDCIGNLLKQAFPHLQDAQVKVTVQGLFDLDQDIPAFKEHLRDFMVQIKEFRSEDVGDLYLEEREKQLQAAQEDKRKVQLSVPGMVNPHDMPEEMQD
ncbi:PREDICTED: exportin-1-like [Acropora digitifera]|uniref:exportin-1-like n=1 Tax=Acropora digitifera TaxID=70779 RepID=UPI00077B04F1|nr:PREDICTED: exportin-1-like [Acropora digitifera]